MSGRAGAWARSARYAAFARAFRYPGESAPADPALGLPGIAAGAGAEFLAAFDPAVAPNASSLHEAAYAGADRAALFEELLRFYGHFGLERREQAELPDHVTVELEFMSFLAAREARAAARGEDTAGLRRAQADFLARHLERLARGILAGGAGSAHPHYAALAAVLAQHVARDRAELGRGG